MNGNEGAEGKGGTASATLLKGGREPGQTDCCTTEKGK